MVASFGFDVGGLSVPGSEELLGGTGLGASREEEDSVFDDQGRLIVVLELPPGAVRGSVDLDCGQPTVVVTYTVA